MNRGRGTGDFVTQTKKASRTQKHSRLLESRVSSVIQDLLGQVLRCIFLRPEILDLVLPILNQSEAKDASPRPEVHSAQDKAGSGLKTNVQPEIQKRGSKRGQRSPFNTGAPPKGDSDLLLCMPESLSPWKSEMTRKMGGQSKMSRMQMQKAEGL